MTTKEKAINLYNTFYSTNNHQVSIKERHNLTKKAIITKINAAYFHTAICDDDELTLKVGTRKETLLYLLELRQEIEKL